MNNNHSKFLRVIGKTTRMDVRNVCPWKKPQNNKEWGPRKEKHPSILFVTVAAGTVQYLQRTGPQWLKAPSAQLYLIMWTGTRSAPINQTHQLRVLWTSRKILKVIMCWTESQWRGFSTGVIWSNIYVAALWRSWSHSMLRWSRGLHLKGHLQKNLCQNIVVDPWVSKGAPESLKMQKKQTFFFKLLKPPWPGWPRTSTDIQKYSWPHLFCV